MVAWRAHMDDQAEEDLHHEDASSIDSVDSTPTGSVDSGRSTASEERQPLFSAAAWRGLVGRVRHLCTQAIGQGQLDVTGSNRSASAVKAWRRRQWAHLNTTVAFRRTTLASLEPRYARPLQLALDALYQSTELHYQIQTTSISSKQDPCKTHLCRRCGSQRAPCYIEGSIMNLGYEAGHIRPYSLP